MHKEKKKLFIGIALFLFAVATLSSVLFFERSFFVQKIFAFSPFPPEMTQTEHVDPKESVNIVFPEPVLDDTYRQRIRVSPSLPLYAKWEEGKTKLVLTPKTNWELGTRYTLTLPEGTDQTFLAKNPRETSFVFSTVNPPKVVDTVPKNGTANVITDIEDPIVVRFAESTAPFWIDFSLSPAADVTFENNPEKTEFRILPKTPLVVGTAYTLTVSYQSLNDTEAKPVEIEKIGFTTFLPAPQKKSSDPEERLAQAKLATQPRIIQGKYIDVNLATQTMVLFENGVAQDAYPVSSGRRGMETPQGEFSIRNKALRPWSKQYSLFMPYWMAILPDGKIGIHELPEWPGGYKEGAAHLGTPVSHGCVRLGVGPAKRVYEWAEVGTPVFIH